MQPLLLPPRTPPPVRAIPPLTAAASLAAVAVLMAWLAGAARPQAPAFQALSTAVGARRVRPAHSLTSGRRAVGHAARSSAPRAMPRAPAPPAVPHAPAPTAAPFQPSALIAMWHVALGIAVAGVAMLVSRLRRPARPTVQTMAAIAPDDLLGPTQGDELPEAAPEAPEDWRSCGVEEVVAHARDTDQFGLAALQYALGVSEEDLYTETNISELDVLPIKYLFRSYDEMPTIERRAMDLCQGRVLDIGCGAGTHALHLQEARGLPVTALDNSAACLRAAQLTGVKDVALADFFGFEGEPYDTLLMLMNGAGICGTLANIDRLMAKFQRLLAPGGQILLDSSDLIYMYDRDLDGGYILPGEVAYYGEVQFTVHYEGRKDKPFDWLYVDYNTLQRAALNHGFVCELLVQGHSRSYLARLTRGAELEARSCDLGTIVEDQEEEEEEFEAEWEEEEEGEEWTAGDQGFEEVNFKEPEEEEEDGPAGPTANA